MPATVSNLKDRMIEESESEFARLQREVEKLRRMVAKNGASAMRDTREVAGDFYDDLAERVRDALPHIRRGSREVSRAATRHPLATAAIGLAVVGLAAALMSTSRR